jgi:hypothetical protein
MSSYIVLVRDSRGSVRGERQIECANDDDAIDLAGGTDDDLEVELWRADNLIARFPSRGGARYFPLGR